MKLSVELLVWKRSVRRIRLVAHGSFVHPLLSSFLEIQVRKVVVVAVWLLWLGGDGFDLKYGSR